MSESNESVSAPKTRFPSGPLNPRLVEYSEVVRAIRGQFYDQIEREFGPEFKGFATDHPLTPEERGNLTSNLIKLSRVVNRHVIDIAGLPQERDTAGQSRSSTLESSLSTVFQAFQDENGPIELYPTPFEKAERIIHGITREHPFMNGNKRTGFYTAMIFLNDNGYPLSQNFDPGEIYNFFKALSVGTVVAKNELPCQPLSDEEILNRIIYLWGYKPSLEQAELTDEDWERDQKLIGDRISTLSDWANKRQEE